MGAEDQSIGGWVYRRMSVSVPRFPRVYPVGGSWGCGEVVCLPPFWGGVRAWPVGPARGYPPGVVLPSVAVFFSEHEQLRVVLCVVQRKEKQGIRPFLRPSNHSVEMMRFRKARNHAAR